ncbi:zinc finger protein-domain-containing protein [Aspergillus multicolor]|uniref:zinc finger protein n=1 Tax=Aspergillus multicolor TaxID=41759 RepID=UPI003CCE3DD8
MTDSSEESELASAVPSGPRKNKAQPSSAKTAALNGRCFTTIKPTNISCAVTSKKASSIMQTQYNINIPLCHGFIEPFNAWWKKNLARFPEGYEPCNMIHAQRIPAVPEATRCFLTEHYCPPSLIANILDSDTNRDCIIRPYLGRRRVRAASKPSRFQAFSLRNYPLHLDQMEEIGIPGADIAGYARTMAKALAQLHWLAHVDGNDIEFVLASPNDKPDPSQKPESWSNALGVHEMWMLDFDLARPMTMVEQGAQQAAIAFKGNDPYYPRPDKDSYLWIAFREQYLATSQVCLQDSQASKDLPAYFIHLVEELNGANNHNQ